MNEIISYSEEKIIRENSINTKLSLISDEEDLIYTSEFITFYNCPDKNKISNTRFFYKITINRITGNILLFHHIDTNNDKRVSSKSIYADVENDFDKLKEICLDGFSNSSGKKRRLIFGVKNKKPITTIFDKIKEELLSYTVNEYLQNKDYGEKTPLYDLIVDFHLSKKGIKFHDSVYCHIQEEYPKKKWLKLNDNKFLPAILDSYGIKTKYLVGKLSVNPVKIKPLVFLCKLFGDNYIDYIKRFNWERLCSTTISTPTKFYTCKTESEKKSIINIILLWETMEIYNHNPLDLLYSLFTVRKFLEKKEYNIKFKPKDIDELEFLVKSMSLIKKQLTLGYRYKYSIPKEIVDEIESPILSNGMVFIPKLLLSENDFILEGIKMKNCMARQFFHGAIFIFISLATGKEIINLQYKKGEIINGYGKANTPMKEELFKEAYTILGDRLKKHNHLTWKKEKQYLEKSK